MLYFVLFLFVLAIVAIFAPWAVPFAILLGALELFSGGNAKGPR